MCIRDRYVDDGKIQELKDKQNPFLWFLSFAHQNDYDMSATTTYDKDMLYAAVDALEAFQEANITQPADAYLLSLIHISSFFMFAEVQHCQGRYFALFSLCTKHIPGAAEIQRTEDEGKQRKMNCQSFI